MENANVEATPAKTASETTDTGYDSTITVELGNISEEVDIDVAQDVEVVERREAMGDSLAQPAQPVGKPQELTDQAFEIISRPVDGFASPINNINTPSEPIDAASNELTESGELVESGGLAKADVESGGDSLGGPRDLTVDADDDPDTPKGFGHGISAVMEFNATVPLKFDEPGQVAVHGLGDKLGSPTGLHEDMAGMILTVYDFDLMDLDVTEVQKVVNHKGAGKGNELLETADTLCTISQHDPWHMVNLEGQSRIDATKVMREWGWVMTGRRY